MKNEKKKEPSMSKPMESTGNNNFESGMSKGCEDSNGKMAKQKNGMQGIDAAVSRTILQKPLRVRVGEKEYQVAAPTIATLIMVSEALSELPEVDKCGNPLNEVLSVASHSQGYFRILAIFILGAKAIKEDECSMGTMNIHSSSRYNYEVDERNDINYGSNGSCKEKGCCKDERNDSNKEKICGSGDSNVSNKAESCYNDGRNRSNKERSNGKDEGRGSNDARDDRKKDRCCGERDSEQKGILSRARDFLKGKRGGSDTKAIDYPNERSYCEKGYSEKQRSRLDLLTDEILNECSPTQAYDMLEKIIKSMCITDFFAYTVSLQEVNIVRKLREAGTTVSGQSSPAL